MNQEFEHLSDAQIENYGYGPDQGDPQTDRAIESHLDACEQCRSRLLAHERSRLGLMIDFPVTAARGTNCPTEDSLRNLAAGIAPASDATRLTQHAAQCDYCGPILRAYSDDFSDELSPDEQALLDRARLSPARRQNLAEQMARAVTAVSAAQKPDAERVSFFRLPWFKWVLVPATAIACAIIAFLVWNAQRDTPQKVEKLLAQAYSEQRTMEMRIPYAAHADFKQTRSGDTASLLSSPEALRKAADAISANLKKNPDDPTWLMLSARLDLLDWRYKSALSTLNKIDDEKVEDSPEFRLTQSLALYQKAEIEHDPQSYGKIVDLLGKTLQRSPNDPVALFNQAVACEKIYMYECATTNYQKYLQIDANSGWAKEAREHLNRIKEKKTPER